jgi:hypothetical protein
MMFNNSYASNSPIGDAFHNLTSTMLNPSYALNAQRLQGLIPLQNAETQRAQAEAGLVQQKLKGAQSLGDAVSAAYGPLQEGAAPSSDFVGPMPQQSRDTQVQAAIPQVASSLAQLGQAKDIGDYVRGFVANAPGVSQHAVDQSQLGAGNPYSGTQTGFEQNQQRETTQAANIQTGENSRNAATLANQRQIETMKLGNAIEPVTGDDGKIHLMTHNAAIQATAPAPGVALSGLNPKQELTKANYITQDGQRGITLDGKTDAATGKAIPPNSQVFTGNVTAQAPDALADPVRAEAQAKLAAIGDLRGTVAMARQIGDDPRNYGAAGFIREHAQNMLQQGDALAQTFGTGVGQARDFFAKNASSLGLPADYFDPKIPQTEQMEHLLTFQIARFLAGGQRLSNFDLEKAQGMIGATGAFGNKAEFGAKMDTLGQMMDLEEKNARSRLQASAATRGLPNAPSTIGAAPAAPAGGIAQRLPGETPAQYLARTQAQ